ncbi:prolyl-tRNA editing protein ProX-like isoform X2 [Salvia hispanica]|uniref:prolyl-tRNA editing protein ProX-like isoform X2 n=1 Tax=Salvia hispanica TaxID=49212 RepID=UPI002009968C|nr:prolyl-tRNA editing protein ProX-like isoform X2 [Salvia hispanica]
MSYTKEQLLTRLQELQIGFSQYEHPVVLTVEAQIVIDAKLLVLAYSSQSTQCWHPVIRRTRNKRYYIVSALADTEVDLKVLSQRLGLGKGGVRMAPEEALSEILHVPLCCVTPFALVNESARHVSLLLDKGFKSQECCFFHPLSNDMSIALNAHDLDKFLNSIGKTPAYVDLEATPTVGKDQPPDLASLVPSDALVSANPPVAQESSKGLEKNHTSADKQPVIGAVYYTSMIQLLKQSILSLVQFSPW